MRIPQHPTGLSAGPSEQMWTGNCPFHGTCWEGSGIGHRKSAAVGSLDARPGWNHPTRSCWRASTSLWAWSISSPPIAPSASLSARRDARSRSFAQARYRTRELLDAGYFPEAGQIEELVVEPGLGDAAGLSAPS